MRAFNAPTSVSDAVHVGPRNEVVVSSRRTLILIAAVVVGAISAFLVFNYVNSADDRAQGNARKVDVLKIAKDIPKGLTGRVPV